MARTARQEYPIEKVKEAICANLSLFRDEIPGLTFEEIDHHLWRSHMRVETNTLKRAIRELDSEGVVERRSHPKRKSEFIYFMPDAELKNLPLFEYVASRAEIEQQVRASQDLHMEDEIERDRASISVLHDIAAGHAQEAEFARHIKEVAVSLAREDPVQLILDMAEWVVNDINSLAEKTRVGSSNRREEVRHLVRELGFRRIKAVRFFRRLWRFDPPVGSIPGIMDLPTVPQMINGRRARIDLSLAKERLQQRIVGDRVVQIVSIPQNTHASAVGTDASVGDIRVKHRQGSFIPPTPAVLFVASAAMRVRDANGLLPYWDYDVDPRELERFEDLDAAQQGLLISPRLRREAITDFRHLRSAAMELRQYAQELRVIRGQAQWHPISNSPELRQPPNTTLLIRDGRLFPLVHRLDDYDGASAPDDVLYGEVVRREINAFQEVFHNTAGFGKLGALYGGTVKSPEFSWFSMITFWYMKVRKNITDIPDGFYRPPLNDQAVTHLLFWGLVESEPEAIFSDRRNMIVTFRATRRFSDIAFQSTPQVIVGSTGEVVRIVDEDSEDEWIEFIEQHISDANDRYGKHKRGVPALNTIEEYRAFLDLCRRAGVTMFYSAPARMYRSVIESGSHFLMPRWELATNIEKSNGRLLDDKVFGMLGWLVEEGGLVKDETHAVGGHEELVEGLPLYIPDVVMQAHEMVVYSRDRHVPDVEDRLQQLVRNIRDGMIPAVST